MPRYILITLPDEYHEPLHSRLWEAIEAGSSSHCKQQLSDDDGIWVGSRHMRLGVTIKDV